MTDPPPPPPAVRRSRWLGLVLLVAATGASAQGYGSALQFATGSSPDFVVFGDRPAFNFGTGDFTLELWFSKPNPRLETLFNKRVGCSNNSYWTLVGDTTLTFSIRQNSTTVSFVTSPTVISDGAWHHVAAVREGTSVRLYLDGALDVSTTAGSVVDVSNTGPVVLGTGPCDPATINPALHFSGAADEVMVWGTARTETEIREDRNGIRTGSEPGLLLYWRFDEGEGQVAGDASPNGVSGQLGRDATPDSADPTWIANPVVDREPSASPPGLRIEVFPNPARSALTVAFSLTRPGAARLVLIDPLGREVAAAEAEPRTGSQALRLSTHDLAPGAYLAHLQTADGDAIRLVTVVR